MSALHGIIIGDSSIKFSLDFIIKSDCTAFLTITILERFSFECRKTKTKVITLTDHNIRKQSNEPIRAGSKQIHVARAKRGKTRASKSRLVLVLLLIGRGKGAGFF